MIEINLTPNRPDCTGVHGIARDLAAAGLGTLKSAPVAPVAGDGRVPGQGDARLRPTTRSSARPSRCGSCAASGTARRRNGCSGGCCAIGLRPINALVDITNYITFDRGRPLHVFDAAKVKGNLTVRRAQDGERCWRSTARPTRSTRASCVIADENGVESIAGIMGGEHSGCDENTTDVLIESALWDPLNIAQTGRKLGIITDARYRFERGVDPAFMVPGLELATRMVLDLCGGEAERSRRRRRRAGHTPRSIDFPWSRGQAPVRPRRAARRESTAILEAARLPRRRAPASASKVAAPSWRPDIEGKADLVEEVIRIAGVDRIEPHAAAARSRPSTKPDPDADPEAHPRAPSARSPRAGWSRR